MSQRVNNIRLVSNYQWPLRGDHRIVLADFLVAEAQRLLARAEALVSSIEVTGGGSDADTGRMRQDRCAVVPRPGID